MLLGIVLGWLISVLIAPVFTHVKFQDRPVAFEEIILPWWGYLAVAAVLFLLALAAALAGMWRVRVSPLGVAKRQMPAAFRWWRLIAFLLIIGRTFTTRRYTHAQAQGAVVTSYYWHFVDVVWIALFAAIYLLK